MTNKIERPQLDDLQLELSLKKILNSSALESSRERDKQFPEGASGSLTSQLYENIIGINFDKYRVDHKLLCKRDEGLIKKLHRTKKTLKRINKAQESILPLMTEIYDLKREQQDIKDELLDQHEIFTSLDREREESRILGTHNMQIQNINNDNDDDNDSNDDNINRILPDVPVLSPGVEIAPKSILKKKGVSINNTVTTRYYDRISECNTSEDDSPVEENESEEESSGEEDEIDFIASPY